MDSSSSLGYPGYGGDRVDLVDSNEDPWIRIQPQVFIHIMKRLELDMPAKQSDLVAPFGTPEAHHHYGPFHGCAQTTVDVGRSKFDSIPGGRLPGLSFTRHIVFIKSSSQRFMCFLSQIGSLYGMTMAVLGPQLR